MNKTALLPKEPKPVEVKLSGNPWETSGNVLVTVPIPNDVIITKVTGNFTERDRKLWSFLVAAVWDDILTTRIHEIKISKIHDVFRQIGGDTSSGWIWDSARRLTKTVVEWEEGPDAKRLVGISNLLNAQTHKDLKESGILRFEIPALLGEVVRKPYRFSRLRLHFMLGLSGKYAVTLYMLLESVANLKKPVLDVELNQLRQWLQVAEGKLIDWYDLKRRAIQPAVTQINNNPLAAGFSVEVEEIKDTRAITRLRFIVTKTEERLNSDNASKAKRALPGPSNKTANNKPLPRTAYQQAKIAAKGWDVYVLEREWRDWLSTKANPDYSPASFVAFCKKRGPWR